MNDTNVLPGDGYVRLPQIIGQKEVTSEQAAANRKSGRGLKTPRPAITPLIPVSRAAWYAGIKKGIYPPPVKLSYRISAWTVGSIRALLDRHPREDDRP
ncbi:helix-turn-helix transcriptional regulator [Geomonas oryzae]|uniref:helix-turn-helix transcriptional regulator n=1 Tax=Geomonas oryzae TaxID=2364273 RepID=UPI00100BC3D1|nr:transcriptional regulator [Geomonas oryzae]